MIKHCVQQPAAVGYDNTKKLLQQKYGNPYSIMSMYRKEIKVWPQLMSGDGGSFQKFYNFFCKITFNNLIFYIFLIQLPDNRNQVAKRMHHLKRRFIKDLWFFEEYKRQMEELVSKSYAKKTDVKPDNGKLWYLLHHGVKHPRKPGKVRIVFNCSTNYGGASLNHNLLSRPDLTNQLIGILLRFRTEEMAFLVDIEAMFYQVKVSA